MNEKLLRVACVFEFLIALVAIFAAWSEIGGQGALDLMPWGWKLGFSFVLAGTLVAYTVEIYGSESWWTLRSARWLAAIVVTMVAMGVVTYFYALQADTGESDEGTNISRSIPARQFSGQHS
jgi:drug/metabolite transporter (DMT)-like permease